jgi:hypothetical protein
MYIQRTKLVELCRVRVLAVHSPTPLVVTGQPRLLLSRNWAWYRGVYALLISGPQRILARKTEVGRGLWLPALALVPLVMSEIWPTARTKS